jgi:hypothetical protein
VVGLAILRKKRGMTIIIGDAFNPSIKNYADSREDLGLRMIKFEEVCSI